MNRVSLKKIIISALILIVIAGGGYYLYITKFKTKSATASRYITETATKGTLNVTVAGTGSVSSASTSAVLVPNSGTLTNFKVSTGSAITEGTSLGSVVDPSLQNQISTDQAKLSQANQQLTQAQQKKNTDIQDDTDKITQANVQLTEDQAKSNIDQATLDKDNDAVTEAQNGLTTDTTNDNDSIDNENSGIQEAQSTVDNDNTTLNKENMIAPISGIFENVSNGNGDSVQAGKTLGIITNLNSLQLQVAVDELDISKVVVGQKVAITFADVPGKNYTGTVVNIPDSGTSTNSVTTYNVTIKIDNSTGLKLGMNANATINVQSKENTLMVPSNAIQTVSGKKYVMELSTSSSSSSSSSYGSRSGSSKYGSSSGGSKSAGKLVEVQTGISNQDDVEITSGLEEGQSLLVQLPNVSTTTSSKSGGGMSSGGGYGGGMGGGSGFSGSGGGSSRSGN